MAPAYDENLGNWLASRPWDRAVLAAFAELVQAGPEGPVADVGCGTGEVTAHLHGLGAVIHLTLLDGPRSLADLVDVCTATLGEHPDANALVRRAAHDLLTNRVVRVIR